MAAFEVAVVMATQFEVLLESLSRSDPHDPGFSALLEDVANHQPDPKWATCKAVDGPGFVAWLEQEVRERDVRGADLRHERSLFRWKKGQPADYGAVDRAVTRLGLHLRNVPEDLWILDKETR